MLRARKSAGVPVTRAVHRLIVRGNTARESMDWKRAADAYQSALGLAPQLVHIWVQLGHAFKEQGLLSQAKAAYEEAQARAPTDADPPLHLGHLAHQAHNFAEAGRYYLQSYSNDPMLLDSATGLHRVLARTTVRARGAMIDLLRASLDGRPEHALLPGPPQPRPDRPGRVGLVFDTSDLFAYFAHARLPTGIQRVHIEAINNIAQDDARDVHICCVLAGRDEWLEVPCDLFLKLTALCLSGGERNDPEWVMALNYLHLYLALSRPFVFPRGATLVALGASWSNPNYFLLIREAKAQQGIRYVPLIYDMIPIVTPEHCVVGHKRDFVYWVLGVVNHADGYLVISKATRDDLVRVAALLGRPIDAREVGIIPLDADFRKPKLGDLPRSRLAKWRLGDRPFVLLVSTIESRKGHGVALDAWAELLRGPDAAAVPQLVCVGSKGWMNGAVYRRLERDKVLAERVTMLHGLSDDELALLYRSCHFTIYPSLYEGWGLPITESFCYGKPVITTTSTSMPEAGGTFAVYVEPGSVVELAAAVRRMSTDTAFHAAQAARIVSRFRPRRWADVAGQIEAELRRLAREAGPVESWVPGVAFGVYYPTSRSTASRIWPGLGTGEIFRAGTGWAWPRHDGCWTLAEGGELALGLPAGSGGSLLWIGLLVLGAPGEGTQFRVQVDGAADAMGSLDAHARRWIGIVAPAPASGVLRIRLQTLVRPWLNDDDHDWSEENEREPPMAGLGGFVVHPAGDDARAAALVQAIAFGSLTDLDAYRERLTESDFGDGSSGASGRGDEATRIACASPPDSPHSVCPQLTERR